MVLEGRATASAAVANGRRRPRKRFCIEPEQTELRQRLGLFERIRVVAKEETKKSPEVCNF